VRRHIDIMTHCVILGADKEVSVNGCSIEEDAGVARGVAETGAHVACGSREADAQGVRAGARDAARRTAQGREAARGTGGTATARVEKRGEKLAATTRKRIDKLVAQARKRVEKARVKSRRGRRNVTPVRKRFGRPDACRGRPHPQAGGSPRATRGEAAGGPAGCRSSRSDRLTGLGRGGAWVLAALRPAGVPGGRAPGWSWVRPTVSCAVAAVAPNRRPRACRRGDGRRG